MRPVIAVVSVLLFFLLVFSPVAFAANTITVTTDKSSYTNADTITISGTVSPAPGPGFNAFVQVANPSGSVVFAQSVPVGATTGTFTTSFAAGGSAAWVSGTYTVTATLQGYTAGTTTFQYTAPGGAPLGGVQLMVQVGATSPVYAGQQVQVMALVSWSNGTLAQSFVKVVAHYHDPMGNAHPLGPGTVMARGMYMWTISLPSNTVDGLYFVMVNANTSSTASWGAAGFTVNSQLASQSTLNSLSSNVTKGLSSLQSSVSTLSSALSQLQSSVSGLGSTLGNIQSSLSSLTSTVGSINTAVGQLQQSASGLATTLGNIQSSLTSLTGTAQNLSSQIASISSKVDNAATQASNAANAVGTTQLYVLIVAVLAAITLVLELAILIRKLS